VDYRKTGEKKMYDWAGVSSFKYELNKHCVTNIIDLNIAFGEFQKRYEPDLSKSGDIGKNESIDPARVHHYSKSRDGIGHSNIIIIKNGIIARVEPNGWAPYDNAVNTELKGFFGWKHLNSLQYKESQLLCGVQEDQKCAFWSLLLTYLYVKCPDIRSIDELQDILVRKGRPYLENLMEKWTCFLNRKSMEVVFSSKAEKVKKGISEFIPTIQRYRDELRNASGLRNRIQQSIISMYTQQVIQELSGITGEFAKRNLLKEDTIRNFIEDIKKNEIYNLRLVKNILAENVKTPWYIYILFGRFNSVRMYNMATKEDRLIQTFTGTLVGSFALYRRDRLYLNLTITHEGTEENPDFDKGETWLYSYDIEKNSLELIIQDKIWYEGYTETDIYYTKIYDKHDIIYRFSFETNKLYEVYKTTSHAIVIVNEGGLILLQTKDEFRFVAANTTFPIVGLKGDNIPFITRNYLVLEDRGTPHTLYIYSVYDGKQKLITIPDMDGLLNYEYGDYLQVVNAKNLGIIEKFDVKELFENLHVVYTRENGPRSEHEILYRDNRTIYFIRGNTILHLDINSGEASIYDSVPSIEGNTTHVALIFV
jgi:hypothetical protein